MAKLDLGGEHLCTGTNAPDNDGLEEAARLEAVTDCILFHTTNLEGVRERKGRGRGEVGGGGGRR